MYKLLLCWRYLRTRYIALASIVSVMLGVATMIVVNAVMEGFSHEMQDRIHNILSDVVVESTSLEGMCDAQWHMDEIRQVAGEDIAGMTPTAHVPAMLGFYIGSEYRTQQVNVIGIDVDTYAKVSAFGQYLQHPKNRQHLDFELKENGYDVVDHQADDPEKALPRKQMRHAGWELRRQKAKYSRAVVVESAGETPTAADPFLSAQASDSKEALPADGSEDATSLEPSGDPFGAAGYDAGEVFDPEHEQHTGCVIGIDLSRYRGIDGSEGFLVLPGDDIDISYPTAGKPPKFLSTRFTVVDIYESKMSEYDASFLFVPLEKLQDLRGMIDPGTGQRFVNTIQIKLKPGVDINAFRDKLRTHFPPQLYAVSTWRDKQGPLLQAVELEKAVLNVLLFMIIAVAGFGILAIFCMIVVEKTRDIGILKSLGASGNGVMGIFLTYGFSLGLVGSGVGLAAGLLFVRYINEIADVLGRIRGEQVFDPSVYFFYRIPTVVEPLTVAWITCGAMLIAVLASILPAFRAARLHPVQALRYE